MLDTNQEIVVKQNQINIEKEQNIKLQKQEMKYKNLISKMDAEALKTKYEIEKLQKDKKEKDLLVKK